MDGMEWRVRRLRRRAGPAPGGAPPYFNLIMNPASSRASSPRGRRSATLRPARRNGAHGAAPDPREKVFSSCPQLPELPFLVSMVIRLR